MEDVHGGGQALAGNIANHSEQAALADGEDLEEIAADLARRLIDGLHGVAGERLVLFGQMSCCTWRAAAISLSRRLFGVSAGMAPTFADANINKPGIPSATAIMTATPSNTSRLCRRAISAVPIWSGRVASGKDRLSRPMTTAWRANSGTKAIQKRRRRVIPVDAYPTAKRSDSRTPSPNRSCGCRPMSMMSLANPEVVKMKNTSKEKSYDCFSRNGLPRANPTHGLKTILPGPQKKRAHGSCLQEASLHFCPKRVEQT